MSTAPPPSTAAAPVNGPLTLLRPLLLLSFSLYYVIPTLTSLLLSLQLSTLLDFEAFKDVWFARFWGWFGPKACEVSAPVVVPLLRNAASGVCLDIGPGSGQWLYLFARAQNADITKIYGVEPNVGMHAELRRKVVEAGLEDVYEVVGCGAEELQTKGGISPASIDTILTVQCLCSIPQPEKIIRELYPLLKPGGKWLVYEHIKTRYHGHFVDYWQKAINVIWPHCFGGCNITRPTDEWLMQAGDWDKVNIGRRADEGPYDCLPHVVGTLTKAK